MKLINLLCRCKGRRMVLNSEKLKLCMEEGQFMGHILTGQGVKIDPEKVRAIIEMEAPTSVEEVQRLNRFVNYLAKFLPQLATVMEPIRKLTRKDIPWEWSKQQKQAFQTMKKLATDPQSFAIMILIKISKSSVMRGNKAWEPPSYWRTPIVRSLRWSKDMLK